MSTTVKQTMTYDADCDRIFEMFRDETYIGEKLAGTGGFDPEISITEPGSEVKITAARSVPAEVPGFVKKFTGDEIRIVEVQDWSPADDLGARTAKVTLEFSGTPSTVQGTLDLRPQGDGAEVLVDFDVKASVPLVGGKIERVIADQIERAIRQENKIGNDWLSKQ